jgi:hypothetical protein
MHSVLGIAYYKLDKGECRADQREGTAMNVYRHVADDG